MRKNPPPMRETQVRSQGWENSLEEEMATHSSILAWEIPGQRTLAGYSLWSCKEFKTTERLRLLFSLPSESPRKPVIEKSKK